MSFNVTHNVTHDVTLKPIEKQIITLMKKNPKISTEKIAMSLGVSSRTIKRYIKEMKNIRFVGHGSNGHCEIDD